MLTNNNWYHAYDMTSDSRTSKKLECYEKQINYERILNEKLSNCDHDSGYN